MTATELRSPLSTHNRRRSMPNSSSRLPAAPDSPTQSKSLLASIKGKNLMKMAPLINPLFENNSNGVKTDYYSSATSENRTLPDDEFISSRTNAPSSIFQRSASLLSDDDERSDMWTLKRANPVLDSDDEDDCEDELTALYASPSKRRLLSTLDDDDEPLLLLSPGRHSADRFFLQDDGVRE